MFLPSAVYTAMNKGNDEGGRLSRLPGCRVCLRLIWNEVFSFQVLGIQDVFTHSGLFFKPSVVITTTPYCIYEKGTFTSPDGQSVSQFLVCHHSTKGAVRQRESSIQSPIPSDPFFILRMFYQWSALSVLGKVEWEGGYCTHIQAYNMFNLSWDFYHAFLWTFPASSTLSVCMSSQCLLCIWSPLLSVFWGKLINCPFSTKGWPILKTACSLTLTIFMRQNVDLISKKHCILLSSN